MKKIALAVLAFAAMGAQAADEGVYVGLNYNKFKFSCDDCGDLESQNTAGVYGGYRMGNVAGEIARYQKTKNGVKVVVTDFAAIPRLNVAKDVDLLGKVGLRYSELSGSEDKFTGTSLVVGAGVEYAVTPELSARAMVDYSSKTFGESIHTTTTTIGVAYKF